MSTTNTLSSGTEKTNFFQKLVSAGILHVVLTLIALSFVLPFVWMILTSLKTLDEVTSENWLPAVFQWGNYAKVFSMSEIQFGRWYWNSLFVAFAVTFVNVFSSAMAAFAFSRLQWPGRDKVFLLYLATMMLPPLVLMIPNYQLMIKLGLVDTYAGLIFPVAFTAMGTFLLRQFMMSVPASLDEAAEVDGATKWQLFWEVILPLTRPGLITLTIFTFIMNYNNFFWPLVMMKSEHRYTLPIGLLFFDSAQQGQDTHLMMAAITMSVVPMIIIFVILQKYLVKGIQMGAVKG